MLKRILKELKDYCNLNIIWSFLFSLLFTFTLTSNLNAKSLKGIKEFNLTVEQKGDCMGETYFKEVRTNIKYVLSNSKIILTDKIGGEYIYVSILTLGNSSVCSSYVSFTSYNYDHSVKNSAGFSVEDTSITSFDTSSLFLAQSYEHKNQIVNWAENTTKEFVIEWNESQK